MKILENKKHKIAQSEHYNSIFDKETGMFQRWGKIKDEDPQYCEHSPEILDLEISQGVCSMKCKHCYKKNGEDNNTHHMTFDEFKNIFHKVANTKAYKNKEGQMFLKNESLLQQIAFGITDVNANPDFFKMMEYSRKAGVIPNYTTNGMYVTESIARETASLCGAVAVSVYQDKNIAYDAIKKFTDIGMKQVNIHYLLAEQTYDRLFEIFDDYKNDKRLSGLNAIILLGYKPKGNNIGDYDSLSQNKFKQIVDFAFENDIKIGFDSCSANKFVKAIKDRNDADLLTSIAEPCESGCFSSYINSKGKFYACSFCEGEGMWKEGIDVLNCNNFLKDVWNHEKTVDFRNKLLDNNRRCVMYNIDED